MTLALALIGSLVTSFIGSFLCFVIWVHFDFEARWEARRARHRLKDLQHVFQLEQEWRLKHGMRPLPESGRGLLEWYRIHGERLPNSAMTTLRDEHHHHGDYPG